MESQAKDVTAFIEEAPAEPQEVLKKLGELCQSHLTGFTGNMAYGGPTYSRDG